jgi:GNAT superfamily N-acetyltransferase
VIEMLRNDKNYYLFISIHNESVIGISLMYTFTYLKIGLLDYIAVTPDYQGKGIGKMLFKFSLHKLEKLVSNVNGLLIEVQRENLSNSLEDIARKNRIRFYMGLGAKIVVGVDYLLPSLQPRRRQLLPGDIKAGRHYMHPSGIRIGVPEITRLGMKESEMKEIANFIKRVVIDKQDPNSIAIDVYRVLY